MSYETRITRLTVCAEGKPLFDESVTHVQIADEAAGEFIEIEQSRGDISDCVIQIDDTEWPAVRAAVDRLMAEIAAREGKGKV